MTIEDKVGAFCAHAAAERRQNRDGPLAGLSFAVKDNIDVAGLPTGNGSPDWLATHAVPAETAPVVDVLINAGAVFMGNTHMDELAWSLMGENAHYGTPINSAAPDRVPGGSSSGSAAATAAGLVDFAVGSDTGGSVRLPASFCGLYGLRPTHGRIPVRGVVPLAPSYDSVGLFARSASILSRVAAVLLGGDRATAAPRSVVVAEDLFSLADLACAAALRASMGWLEARLGPTRSVRLLDDDGSTWRDAFRTIQAFEAWATHGDWIRHARPSLGPGVRERFAAAPWVTAEQTEAATQIRRMASHRLSAVLGHGAAVMVLPTSPAPAPLRGSSGGVLEDLRSRALSMLCVAGHAGAPQVSIPGTTCDGLPIGLSILASPGQDEHLLRLVTADDGDVDIKS